MNKKILIVIIPIIFLFTGCQQSNTANLAQKTYESKGYDFKLNYPANWNLYYDDEKTGDRLESIRISPKKEKKLNNGGEPVLYLFPVHKDAAKSKLVDSSDEMETLRKLAILRNESTLKQNKDVNVQMIKDEIVVDGNIIIRKKFKNIKMRTGGFTSTDYVLGNSSKHYFIQKDRIFEMGYQYPVNEEDKYSDTFEKIVLSLKFQ